jgi:hypothetical protein
MNSLGAAPNRLAGARQGSSLNEECRAKGVLIMKKFLSVSVMLAVMVVGLVTVSAFAQEVSRTIVLKRDTKIGGQVLPKGEYEVKYVEGKEELVIAQGRRQVLTATYKVSKLDKAPAATAVISTQGPDGSFQLKRIEFKGRDSALTFENTVAKAISQ